MIPEQIREQLKITGLQEATLLAIKDDTMYYELHLKPNKDGFVEPTGAPYICELKGGKLRVLSIDEAFKFIEPDSEIK